MSCTPLAVGVGTFVNTGPGDAWSAAPSTTLGGKTVTLSPPGSADPGITVTGPNGTSLFHQTVGTDVSRYVFFGSSSYLLLLEAGTGPSPEYTVSVVNFTTSPISEVLLPTVLADSTSVSYPTVQYSPGTGSAFLLLSLTGTEWTAQIYRSDNGELLNGGPGAYDPTGPTQAQATATQTIIDYDAANVSNQFAAPLPTGRLAINPAMADFPPRVVGGCPTPPPTVQVTLENTGNDCLLVNSIGNAGPFSVAATSEALPAGLPAGTQLTVTVSFDPSAVGTYGPTNLPVAATPAVGASTITCEGTGRDPIAQMSVSPDPMAFGNVQVGGAAVTQNLTISNTGEQPLQVSMAASQAGSVFSWPGYSGSITCGASVQIPVSFAASGTGPATGTLTVISDAPTSPVTVPITATGVLQPEVSWSPATLAFGSVPVSETGSACLSVSNSGQAQLSVTGITCLQGFSTGNGVTSFTVDPGQTFPLWIELNSGTVNPLQSTSTLSFDTNDPAHPTVSVPITYSLNWPPGCLSAGQQVVRRTAAAVGSLYRRLRQPTPR